MGAGYDRAVIVGVGLLGGSIGLALQQCGLARHVIGVGRDADRLEAARRVGAITRGETDLTKAVTGADLVVICTPVRQIANVAKMCLPLIAADGLVTDVGSTKASICQEVERSGGAQQFCGAHPLAGSEKRGVENADATLFRDRNTIITPTASTPEQVVEKAEQLWRGLGSRTIRMTPKQHDEALAWTSHMPHVVAAALAQATPDEFLHLAASGWTDTTRIAAAGVDLWTEILLENRQSVLAALQEFDRRIAEWLQALQSGDESGIEKLLTAGKKKRESVGS